MFKEIPLEARTEKRGARRGLIYGVGINDAPYQVTIKINGTEYTCPYFTRWQCMLNRCYSPTWLKRNPTYRGCEVTPEWHSFMTFKSWMIKQDWEGKQLDKDLLSLGKKVYSPDTCLFVSRQVNSLFNERTHAQGDLPLGIYARKGKYEVGVSLGKGRTWVGAYATIPEAIDAYIAAKLQHVAQVIKKESNPQVQHAIKKYAEYFADKLRTIKTAF